ERSPAIEVALDPVRIGDLAEFPESDQVLVASKGTSGDFMCFDQSAALDLLVDREAAEANTAIARELGGAVEALQGERAALVDAGRACEERNRLLREQLAHEQAARAVDKFW